MKRLLLLSLAVLISVSLPLFPQSIGMVAEEGGFRHLPSASFFPPPSREGTVLRLPERVFPDGSGALVCYSAEEMPAEIEIRIYPADVSLEEECGRIAEALGPAELRERGMRRRVSGPFEAPGIVCELSSLSAGGNETGSLVVLEIYRRSGWFLSAQLRTSHDGAPAGRELLKELLAEMSWPQPAQTLPITYTHPHLLTYRGNDYIDRWDANFLPFIRMLQEEPGISAETAAALREYEKTAERQVLASSLFLAAEVALLGAQCYGLYLGLESVDTERNSDEWVAAGVYFGSALTAIVLYFFCFPDDSSPWRELGMANHDLLEHRRR